MKSRILPSGIIIVLILFVLVLWLTYTAGDQGNTMVLDAIVNRDCAPWDGSAFTVSIAYDPISSIEVSIWQSPNIKGAVTFFFPDKTGSVGNAIYRSQFGLTQPLKGKVFFSSVSQENPIEGDFNLLAETGQ